MSRSHFTVWVVALYMGLNLVFAGVYASLGNGDITGLDGDSGWRFILDCFFFSIQTFSTIGYGHISPVSIFANIVVSVEAFTGMMSIAVMSGLLFSRFSRPQAKVVFSQHALVTKHLGKTCLIFRMANARLNQVAEASVRVTTLKFIRTADGQEMRIQEDLELLRDHSQIFAASWLVAHVIDEKSPLWGLTPLQMQELHLEILVSLTGYDEVYSQTIYARFSYLYDEVLFDRQFANIVTRKGNRLHVEIEKISELQSAPTKT
jgi:inward rectifier potassium channel